MKKKLPFVILFLFLPCAVFADPQQELSKTNKELKQASINTAKLEAELKKLAVKEKELKSQMVKTAGELQSSEAELSSVEEKMRILNNQIEEKTTILANKKRNMAVMVQAVVKLSQTPEEAIILMPGDMQESMKASRALKMTTDSIKQEAEDIRKQMAELANMKEKLQKDQQEATERKAELEEQRKLLKAQIAEHSAMKKKLQHERQAAKEKAQNLARRASDLQDLIAGLEREKAQMRKGEVEGADIEEDSSAPSWKKGKLRSFLAAKGKIRVPAAGKLVQKFGVEGKNDTSKGVTIVTRANAPVTSPFDAEVIFTGPFMDYGRVVILRHSNGFHTLLAGLAHIDASVGDYVVAGEPVGSMGEQSTRLYMELRSDNQPTDPAPWIRGMGKL